jgi:hypothetical protein
LLTAAGRCKPDGFDRYASTLTAPVAHGPTTGKSYLTGWQVRDGKQNFNGKEGMIKFLMAYKE